VKDNLQLQPGEVAAIREEELRAWARRLGYRFRDLSWLERALRHSSYIHEHPEAGASNEQLEFLGDAVLGLTVSHLLVAAFPEKSEGELSRRRAALVNARQLADLARGFDLGRHLLLGRGEEGQAGGEKPSLLADALEAVLAAVYLDGGFRAAQNIVARWFAPLLAKEQLLSRQDAKTALQEFTQARLKITPAYHLIEARGPGHDRRFKVELRLGDTILAEGEGSTKKQAAQEAAARGLKRLQEEEEKEKEGGGGG
jgi:ribonuclease-3